MTGPAASPNGNGASDDRRAYCGHTGAREIRFYGSYGDANTCRLRSAEATSFENLHTSRLYAIPGGWAWTICRECRLVERARVLTGKRPA